MVDTDESPSRNTLPPTEVVSSDAVFFKPTSSRLSLGDSPRKALDSLSAGLKVETTTCPAGSIPGSDVYHRTPDATTAIPAAMDSNVDQGDRPFGPATDSNASASPSNSDRSMCAAISSAIDGGAS